MKWKMDALDWASLVIGFLLFAIGAGRWGTVAPFMGGSLMVAGVLLALLAILPKDLE